MPESKPLALGPAVEFSDKACTAAVGDPPPAHPQHYVSHPSLKCLTAACGMFLLGTEEWVFRLSELIVSIPALLLILFLLRKLYASGQLN